MYALADPKSEARMLVVEPKGGRIARLIKNASKLRVGPC